MRFPCLYIATGTRSNRLGRIGAAIIGFFNRLFPPPPPNPESIRFTHTDHGKVVPLQTARELVSVKENVRVPDLEQVIPYKLARSIILDHRDHIAALDCPCRVARENPCLPLDLCLIVGETFAGMCITPSSRRQCASGSTPSATAVPAAAARCRRTRSRSAR